MNKPSRLGKYLLFEQIHLGSLAEVFIARADGIAGAEPVVALKRLLPSVSADPGLVSLFVDEAKIATQLSHGNIAHVLEVGRQDDTYFISMEYVSGRSLQALLAHGTIRGKPMPVAQAAFLASELCQGLDYAHRRKDLQGRDLGIVHRGVSPGNVLLSYDGSVKLIDFGMAKAASSSHHTVAGAFRGKIGYMSPEQIRGQVLDRRSDVFSIGLVLYEMLTGAKAFSASSDVEAMRQVSDADVRPPRSLNPKLPEALEAVVLKALARERKDRYQWASELREALLPFTFAGGSVFSTQQLAEEMTRLFSELARKEAAKLRELAAYHEPKRPDRASAPTQQVRGVAAALSAAEPYEFGQDGEEEGATQLVSAPFDLGPPPVKPPPRAPKPRPEPEPDLVTPEMMSAVTRQIPWPKDEETRPTGKPLGTTQPRLKPIDPDELESPPTDPPEPPEDQAPPPIAPRLPPPSPPPPRATGGVPGWIWAVVAIAVLAVAGAALYALRPRTPVYSMVTVRVLPPEHALVTVAGRLVENGKPLQLPPGQYDLVASAPGFKQHIQQIAVLAHAPNVFTVLLEPEPPQQQQQTQNPQQPQQPQKSAETFTARFVSLEPGVEILIDGKSIGRTPHAEVTLPVGSAYLYTAQQDGFEKAHGIFGSSGEPVVTVTVALRKHGSQKRHRHSSTGALVCSTEPTGAMVIVDGSSTGVQTPVFPDDPLILPAGTHQVVFLLGETKTAPRTVEIEKGKVAVLKDIRIAQGQPPPTGTDPEPPQELKKDGAAGDGTPPATNAKKDTASSDPEMPEPMTQ